jgi:hypothetical protein
MTSSLVHVNISNIDQVKVDLHIFSYVPEKIYIINQEMPNKVL